MDPVPEHTGRTFFDFVHQNRRPLAVVLGIAAAIILIRVYNVDLSPLIDVLLTWYPILIAPVIGYIAGVIVVDKLIDVPCTKLIVLNPGSNESRSWLIPNKLFATFTKPGNSFQFHDGFGKPVYYCESVDFQNRTVFYCWPHSLPYHDVISNLEYYNMICKDYNDVTSEVLILRRHLSSVALKQTRSVSREFMDEILSVMNSGDNAYDIFRDTIFEDDISVRSPVESEPDSDPDRTEAE